MTTKQFNSVGPTFMAVGAAGKIRLGDIKVEGTRYDKDFLQVLSKDNAATIATYTYVTPEWDEEDFEGDGAAVGWWIKNHEGESAYSAKDVEFDIGQGFLGNFPTKAVKFTYAGEVVSGSTQIDLTGKQFNLVANFLPMDIRLGSVVLTGTRYDKDFFQELSDTNAATIKTYTYVTPEWDEEDFEGDGAAVGWWIKNHEGEPAYSAKEVWWNAGQAFLSNFPTKAVKFTFPDALNYVDPYAK